MKATWGRQARGTKQVIALLMKLVSFYFCTCFQWRPWPNLNHRPSRYRVCHRLRLPEVMVILTAKQGVTPQQIMNVVPAEIRATARLNLDDKIRQWYSRGGGRGVVLFLDVETLLNADIGMRLTSSWNGTALNRGS
jgi:hypothetical protein